MINYLDYEGIKFLKRIFKRYKKNNICINVFCYENNLTYPVYVSDQKFKNYMDLLLIPNGSKSHYVHIKDFNRFMCNETRNKNKKHLCKCCLQCFSSEKILIKHKENCLIINGKQSVRLKSGSVRFKNYFKQIAVPIKVYADFECLLKGVQSSDKDNSTYTKNTKIKFLAVLVTTLSVLIINSVKMLFFTVEKMQSIESLKQFLKSMSIVKK